MDLLFNRVDLLAKIVMAEEKQYKDKNVSKLFNNDAQLFQSITHKTLHSQSSMI
eukprot:m.44358 g.44358  ORF g.44358 m.44358 type:complete len:54 (+) comp12107_c0_seq1:299-460(+)